MIEVELPDGRVLEVDTTDQAAAANAAKSFLSRQGSAQPSTPAPEPTTGMLEAIGLNAAQGVAANFADEFQGLRAAGREMPIVGQPLGAVARFAPQFAAPLEAATGAGAMLAEYISGKDLGATKKYQEESKAFDDRVKLAQKERPIASFAGQAAGAVALPGGALLKGAALAERMRRGAGVGAGYGALYGAGDGDTLGERATNAATGTVLGTVAGAGAPVLLRGAEAVAQGARALAQPVVNAFRSARDPQAEAARRVVTALDRDIAIDPNAANRLSRAEFAASAQGGGPARVMDIGGETTRALARSAANTSPEGRALLNQTINDRFEGQTSRVNNWFNDAFNFPNAHAQQEAIEATAKAVNTPAYLRAMTEGSGGLWDEGFEQIAQAPIVQDAIRKATITGGNRAAREGFTPVRSPFTLDPTSGRMVLRTNEDGSRALPNLKFWDDVKKNLDKVGSFEARDFARVLRTHLDDLVPSYREARAGAAHFFAAENALEGGQNFVTQNFANQQARQALAKMSPTERQLFQDGFVSRFMETLDKVGDRRSILNKIAESPAAREKLQIALGRQRATELEAGLRVEGIMDLARSAVQGNSTTARQLAELGLAGGTYTIGTGGNVLDPNGSAILNAALVYGAARGKARIDERVARQVAELLTSADPSRLRAGIQILARDSRMLEALRRADGVLARLGGQQASEAAPMLPAIQGSVAGRAEEDRPN